MILTLQKKVFGFSPRLCVEKNLPNRMRLAPFHLRCNLKKKSSRRDLLSATFRRIIGRIRFARMKAKIIITPKKAVLDPQGKTVQSALEHMGYSGIGAVHVGKYLEIEVTGDKETVRKQIDEACHKFLSNPVIEDYKLELE
jgi:phosphoribosylformylglycinamidine synthase